MKTGCFENCLIELNEKDFDDDDDRIKRQKWTKEHNFVIFFVKCQSRALCNNNNPFHFSVWSQTVGTKMYTLRLISRKSVRWRLVTMQYLIDEPLSSMEKNSLLLLVYLNVPEGKNQFPLISIDNISMASNPVICLREWVSVCVVAACIVYAIHFLFIFLNIILRYAKKIASLKNMHKKDGLACRTLTTNDIMHVSTSQIALALHQTDTKKPNKRELQTNNYTNAVQKKNERREEIHTESKCMANNNSSEGVAPFQTRSKVLLLLL